MDRDGHGQGAVLVRRLSLESVGRADVLVPQLPFSARLRCNTNSDVHCSPPWEANSVGRTAEKAFGPGTQIVSKHRSYLKMPAPSILGWLFDVSASVPSKSIHFGCFAALIRYVAETLSNVPMLNRSPSNVHSSYFLNSSIGISRPAC